jgi:hypothetical protein
MGVERCQAEPGEQCVPKFLLGNEGGKEWISTLAVPLTLAFSPRERGQNRARKNPGGFAVGVIYRDRVAQPRLVRTPGVS